MCVFYLWDDKLPSEKTNCWQYAVQEEWDWCEWINCCVNISKSLQEFKPSSIAIPYGTMPAEKNFNGTKSPPKHLIQTIRKVDRSRSLESWSLRHAVDWPPASSMHLESSENVFCNRTIDPSDLWCTILKTRKHQFNNKYIISNNRSSITKIKGFMSKPDKKTSIHILTFPCVC
jgi:hypothetical protein